MAAGLAGVWMVVRHLSWVVPLALGAVLLSLGIGEPWTGSYDANGARYSLAARNTLRYGLWATRGGQVVNGGVVARERFRVYAHHPPGISLAIAGSFAVFGESEWSARVVFVAFTLGAAGCLVAVGRVLGGPWLGGLAALVLVVQPMVAFYGRMPDHEAPGAFFALLIVALYLRWWRGGRVGWLAGASVAAFVGMGFAWAVFPVPWLVVAWDWAERRRASRGGLVVVGAAIAGFVAVLAHSAMLSGGVGELWQALAHRAGSAAGDRGEAARFAVSAFAGRQCAYFAIAFTLLALPLCGIGLVAARRTQRPAVLLTAALAVFGLFNVLAFKQGAYVHIYYQFYLAVALALGTGLGLEHLRRRLRRGASALVVGSLVVLLGVEGAGKLARIRSERTPDYELQCEVAPALRRLTGPAERVLVQWDRASMFRQLTYYADRDVTVVREPGVAQEMIEKGGFDAVFRVAEPVAGTAVLRRWSGGGDGRAPGRPPGR